MKVKAYGLLVASVLMVSSALWAQGIPRLINYQGRLADSGGVPLDGVTVNFHFSLYGTASGVTVLWSETQSAVPVVGGIYNVQLGGANALGLPFDQEYWLGVKAGIDNEMTPRYPLTAAPYAFNAIRVFGDPYVLKTGDTVNGPLDLNGTLRIGPQAASPIGILYSSTNSPNMGAVVTGQTLAVYALNTTPGSSSFAVLADPTSGLYASAGSATATGTEIGGSLVAVSQGNVIGASVGATGVGSNSARGVMSITSNTGSGEATGGYFVAMDQGTGTHYGVVGRTMDASGVHYGVQGQVATPDGYGVRSVGNAKVEGHVAVDGVVQDLRTKKQIGALKWHEANVNRAYSSSDAYFAAAFDSQDNIYFTRPLLDDHTSVFIGTGGLGSSNSSIGYLPLGIAHDGMYTWMANQWSDNISYNGAFGSNLVSVGMFPTGLCYGGRYLWVANMGSNDVSIVDPAVASVVGLVPVGVAPYWTSCAVDNVWVTNSGEGTVTKIRKSDGAVLGTYPVGGDPRGIAFDGLNVWVATGMGDEVVKLRESDGAEIGRYNSGGINAFGVVFDGAHVWVTNADTNDVTKLRAIDGSLIGTYDTCLTPRMPAFDGVSIWVPCEGGGYQKM